MENNSLFILALAIIVVLVFVWVIYRNFKDEKKFEKNMDDPKREYDVYHDRKKI